MFNPIRGGAGRNRSGDRGPFHRPKLWPHLNGNARNGIEGERRNRHGQRVRRPMPRGQRVPCLWPWSPPSGPPQTPSLSRFRGSAVVRRRPCPWPWPRGRVWPGPPVIGPASAAQSRPRAGTRHRRPPRGGIGTKRSDIPPFGFFCRKVRKQKGGTDREACTALGGKDACCYAPKAGLAPASPPSGIFWIIRSVPPTGPVLDDSARLSGQLFRASSAFISLSFVHKAV